MLFKNRNEYINTYVFESHSIPVLGCINSELNYRLCLNLFTLNVGIMEIHYYAIALIVFLQEFCMCICVCLIISFGFCTAGHKLIIINDAIYSEQFEHA